MEKTLEQRVDALEKKVAELEGQAPEQPREEIVLPKGTQIVKA